MTDAERDRALLDEERSRLLDLRGSLTEATEDVEREPTGDPSAGGHVADAGSEVFERSRDLSIVHDLDAQLADIEHAKARLANGSYGTCEACGKPIGRERLAARPATRFCIEDQQGAEREGRGRVSAQTDHESGRHDRPSEGGRPQGWPGRRAQAPLVGRKNEIAIVRVSLEGPLLVRGPLLLLDEQGHEVSTRRRVNALCRCGRSTTQPFCDGTHKIVPFSPRAVNGASVSEHGSDSPPG